MSSSTSSPLAGKVALITGSSKGIGAATARLLHSLGAKVVINYSSPNSAPADQLVASLLDSPKGTDNQDSAVAIRADAGTVAGVDALVRATVARWGRIDILVPNAGVLAMRDLAATTEADFDRSFGVNVKGVYFLIQKAVPHMATSAGGGGGGRVILLSTTLTAASTVTPNYLLYLATKGAVEQMTRVLAKDLGRKGITVNAVAPGPTATELFLQGKPEALVKSLAGLNPFDRLGQPEDIAEVIAFLSGEGGRWVNGQVVRVNGGMA